MPPIMPPERKPWKKIPKRTPGGRGNQPANKVPKKRRPVGGLNPGNQSSIPGNQSSIKKR
jgi:hypothetical protein